MNEKKLNTIHSRLGRCFELAAIFVVRNLEWKLVHGVIIDEKFGTGGALVHAWCEKEDRVYDPVLGNELPIYAYYDLYGVVDYKVDRYKKIKKIPESLKVEYTSKEAMENLSKSENYGPWDSELISYKSVAGKSSEEEQGEL